LKPGVAMDERLRGMRILLSTDAVGGVWTYTLDLARELCHNGIETVLAVLGPPPADAARAAALRIPGVELVSTGLPLEWTADTPDQVMEAGVKLAELARAQRCALVQLHTPALAAARSFDMPVVAVHHSCVATWWRAVKPADAEMPEDFRWRSATVARGIAACSQVVAPTTAHAHAIAETYALSSPPLVIRNGRAPAPTHADVADEPPPFILSSGRLWDEGKNFASLNRAAALLNTTVVAAGAATSPQGFTAEFPALRMLGAISEEKMRQWLSLARAYVSVAVYEPFGLGVLEAAQAGCPLVLSDTPGFRELWAGAALFVPPQDEQAIARSLSQIMADDGLRERLSRRARYRAVLYSSEAMGRDMMRLYALHLALHRPPRERAA
jgi:glycosyltransferase involved in cell wall biosynthesis